MRVNPSLTARLRIGFGVLFALLLAVSLLGVGRLFQIRVNYEDDLTRYFQLELESERLRSAFVLEQAATRPATPRHRPSQVVLQRAAAGFAGAADRAREITGSDAALNVDLDELVGAESSWRRSVGLPLVRGKVPAARIERRRIAAVTKAGETLARSTRQARDDAQEDARSDTRGTTILVAAGLIGGLLAALILFTGLINSMRAPLGRLLEITEASSLLGDAPALQRRLSHRNPWIDPLSHLQVELLARSRADQSEAREPLLATITGIAAGMRNTG